jgi:predicted RNase H-like HicB family nuclease
MFYSIFMLIVNTGIDRNVNFSGCGREAAEAGRRAGWRCEMTLSVQCERDEDGRWLARMPGAIAYGDTIEEAMAKVEALALQAADQVEHGEAGRTEEHTRLDGDEQGRQAPVS